MILLLDVNSAVIQHLRRQWNYTSDIEYENVTIKPEAPYIRLTIFPTGNQKRELGIGGNSKFDATLSVDVFTVMGTGAGESNELLSHVMQIYPAGKRIVSDGGRAIRFTAPQLLQGLNDGHGFWQATIHCPFYFYH